MDAFYASVEQRDDPSLRGRPVAVGGSRERGVVAAASYEARRFGVRSAMPSVTARRQCPNLVFVPPRFDVYKAVSTQIHAVFARYTTLIQPLSLDEAYLDVTAPLLDRGSATAIAAEIRAAIRAETGLTASAGVSYNKFLAKLASDHRKPDGLFVITPKTGLAFVEELPVGKFHGVGPVTAAKMNRLGIRTGLDLRAQSLDFLAKHFGKAAHYYHGGAPGHAGRTVTVKVKYADFRQITRSRSGVHPVASREELERSSLELLRPCFPPPRGIRLLGVTISNFSADSSRDRPQLTFILDAAAEAFNAGPASEHVV